MSILAPITRPLILTPGWAKNALWRTARAVPSLDLRFADNKSLVDAVTGASLVTFTRASSGTFVDSAGVLQTAATNVPRFDHNPATGESLGLLVEEAMTNLLVGSAAPATQNVTVTAVAHTLHFTGTGTITLTGASTAGPLVGTGTGEANRVSLTFTPTAGALTLTVSGTVTNAQLEAGAFRTSYILNVNTPLGVTRAADVASITGSAFSSWYSQSEGTMFANAAIAGVTGASQIIVQLNNGTESNRMMVLRRSDQTASFTVTDGGSAQAEFGTVSISGSTSNAIAATYKTNDFAMAVRGLAAETDSLGTVPAISQLNIGNRIGGTYLNGTIRRLTYWPQALPSRLQSITL